MDITNNTKNKTQQYLELQKFRGTHSQQSDLKYETIMVNLECFTQINISQVNKSMFSDE